MSCGRIWMDRLRVLAETMVGVLSWFIECVMVSVAMMKGGRLVLLFEWLT